MLSQHFLPAVTYGLLFFVISSPFTYSLVDKLLGGLLSVIIPQYSYLFQIADAGCPTTYGLIVHSVVFAIVVYLLRRR